MSDVVTIPNLLTLLRLAMVPVFLILLEDLRYRDALLVFVAAGVTDALDGAIARLTHTKTTLGAYLDPAADKLLLVSAFIALGFMHEVPRWLTVVVLSRDVMLILGYFLLFMLTQQTMAIRPSVLGKVSTFLQLCAISLVLVRLATTEVVEPVVEAGVFIATGTFTAVAGCQYAVRGLAWLQRQGPEAPGSPGL
ncbi:MAG: CDP-alcohol phosphatidyltransferase family protein [Candidatus Binatia bacterium]